jgi:hypothetical protein
LKKRKKKNAKRTYVDRTGCPYGNLLLSFDEPIIE